MCLHLFFISIFISIFALIEAKKAEFQFKFLLLIETKIEMTVSRNGCMHEKIPKSVKIWGQKNWSGVRESDPPNQLGKLEKYRYTNSASAYIL